MIVLLTDVGYDIVFQPAHGLLAAKIARHWRRAERPRHWLELLSAIAQHDNNQRDFRGRSKLTEAGAPRGFTVSSGESDLSDLAQPRRTLQDAFFQGRYAALMVSLHTSTLYEPKRGESGELDAFLDEQRDNQKRWRRDLGLRKREAEHDYRLMLWCDRASLILCQDQIPAGGRQLEVQQTPGGQQSFLRREGDAVVVEPWPFEADEFTVEVEVHRLERLWFESDEELLDALVASEVRYRSWNLRKP